MEPQKAQRAQNGADETVLKFCDQVRQVAFDLHVYLQVLGYLRASGLRHAMLVNFGVPKIEIKKLIL